MTGRTEAIGCLCALPDGRLASGANDNTIRFWNIDARAETHVLSGHTSWVTSLAMMPDGQLASGAQDNTIRLWDPASGRETLRLEVDAGVTTIRVLATGRIAAGDKIGRMHWLEVAGSVRAPAEAIRRDPTDPALHRGHDGTVYEVHFDFTRGPEAINSAASGREYWISREAGHRHFGVKFVYLVDRNQNRVVPALYVERADGTLQESK